MNNNKKIIRNIIILMFLLYIINNSFNKKKDINSYKSFINECNKLKRINTAKILNNGHPYISICLPVYNMEKYLERAIFSIINQSFQNFEIIIVDDNSNDSTEDIIKNMMTKDNRIKLINHDKNLGVFRSRADAVNNSKGNYIILIDPDDMLLNEDLFLELYKYNLKYNLDIIEFSVYYKEERKSKIYRPNAHESNHYHQFNKSIIYQPILSNIIFYYPNSKNYSSVICRTIWNKLIRKNILIKSIEYIEQDFHDEFLITADDTPINIICFNFANNYSNIDLPGYLYNIRKNSMSISHNDNKHDIIMSINYYLYYKLFYRYIKEFKKDINYLYYDMKEFAPYLLKFKEYKLSLYNSKLISLIKNIKNNTISNEFKDFLNIFLINLN
jgi:glycosyltransferase involved in cell wall biosynthesis